MQTFMFGLLLACVSGVTVVAFKHPGGFSRLFPYLIGLATTVFVGITIWHVAVELSWKSLEIYVDQESLSDARTTKGRLGVPYPWAAFWYLGVVAFLWVNLKLPPFLQIADANDSQRDKKNSR